MSLSRQAFAMRSASRLTIRHAPRTTFQATQSRFASGDYGSGDGDPRGEKPQEQGKSETTRKMEHPGPAAPDVGQTNASSKGSGSSSQGEQSEQPSQKSDKANKTVNGNQPKILADNPPPPSEQSESVKQHNAELDKRKDKPASSVSNEDAKNDKVNPKTWAGQTSG